jgi:hypothetical protein
MRCASCGEKIKGDPIWKEDVAYCSEECAEMGLLENDYEDEEEDEEYDEEEEEKEE